MKDNKGNILKEIEILEVEARNLEYTIQRMTKKKVEVLTKIYDLKNNLKANL
jgi:hypothetical protein